MLFNCFHYNYCNLPLDVRGGGLAAQDSNEYMRMRKKMLTLQISSSGYGAIFEFGLGSAGVKGQIHKVNSFFTIYTCAMFMNRA